MDLHFSEFDPKIGIGTKKESLLPREVKDYKLPSKTYQLGNTLICGASQGKKDLDLLRAVLYIPKNLRNLHGGSEND